MNRPNSTVVIVFTEKSVISEPRRPTPEDRVGGMAPNEASEALHRLTADQAEQRVVSLEIMEIVPGSSPGTTAFFLTTVSAVQRGKRVNVLVEAVAAYPAPRPGLRSMARR